MFASLLAAQHVVNHSPQCYTGHLSAFRESLSNTTPWTGINKSVKIFHRSEHCEHLPPETRQMFSITTKPNVVLKQYIKEYIVGKCVMLWKDTQVVIYSEYLLDFQGSWLALTAAVRPVKGRLGGGKPVSAEEPLPSDLRFTFTSFICNFTVTVGLVEGGKSALKPDRTISLSQWYSKRDDMKLTGSQEHSL